MRDDILIAVVLLLAAILAVLFYEARHKLYLFARAIAFAEGYGVPGAIPTVRNNPGDLILSGGTPTTFATAQAGWDALYRQLKLIIAGSSAHYSLDQTIGQMASIYTATESADWAANVVSFLRSHGMPTVSVSTRLRDVLVT